jgi:transposase InsO family protein
MTGEKKIFTNLEEYDSPIERIMFGDNNYGDVVGQGDIPISKDSSFTNVYLVDTLGYNSLSISQLCEKGYNCLFTDEGVTILRREDSSIAFTGRLKGKLYLVDFTTTKVELKTCLVAKSNLGWLWHRRLAHVGMRNLAILQKGEHILGLTNVTFEKDRLYSTCQAGKQVGAPHPPKNILISSRPLKLFHMDLFDPISYVSIGGNKYGLAIVDDFSRYTWVYFLQDKSEAQRIIKKFIRRAQNGFELKIKNIRSDNGSEFRNLNVEEYLDEEGIKHQLSAPYTPQQNGIVERKNRTLIEMARTMLDEYKTPDSFWAEAINTACHAVNRLYLQKYLGKTPYEILTGNKPKVHYFRVFGCKCYILNKKTKSSKFAPKADEGFLFGYSTNEHAYRVFNKTSGCVEVTVDVKFDESNGSQVEQVENDLVGNEEPPNQSILKMGLGEVRPHEDQEEEQAETQALNICPNLNSSSSTRVEPSSSSQDQDQAHGDDHDRGNDQGGASGEDAQVDGSHYESVDDEPIQRQSIFPHPRVHESIQRDHPVDNILGSIRRGVTTRSRLINFFACYSFVSSLEPLKVEDALGDADWVIAMQEELNNFTRNEVWE